MESIEAQIGPTDKAYYGFLPRAERLQPFTSSGIQSAAFALQVEQLAYELENSK